MDPADLTAVHIRQLRQERLGWSLEEMARYLGVTKPTVWRWEKGHSEPGPQPRAILTQLWNRLEQIEQERRRREFIEALKQATIAGGVIAMLSVLFSEED